MRNRTPVLVTTATLAVALAAPSPAAAVKQFEGRSSQGRAVKLTIGDDNLLQRFEANWITRNCRQRGSRFQNITAFKPPFDEATPDIFNDAGSLTVRDSGRIRSRVSITISGRRTFDPANPAAESWAGTLKASVVVRRGRRVIDRCTRSQITWTAALAP